MKPILEWYQDLPEPIRSQAIENYDGEFAKAKTLERAFVKGFSWYETKQGWNYWAEICNRAESGEFDDPIKNLKRLITRLEERQEQFEKLI